MYHKRFWIIAIVLLVVAALACEGTPQAAPVVQVVTAAPSLPTTQPPAVATVPPGGPPPATEPPPTAVPAAGCSLNGSFVADVTIPDETAIAAGSAFVKTWRVTNSGTCGWADGFQLVFASGEQMGGPPAVSVPATAAGATADVSVNLTAPAAPGGHKGEWRLRAKDGTIFGTRLYVVITVPEPPTATPTNPPVPPKIVVTKAPVFVLPKVVYDFVAKAPKAVWQSWPGGATLPFPGPGDSNGSAAWVNSPTMEDGSKPSRCLGTHPKWVTGGSIQGTYTDVFYSGYIVDASDRLVAHAGFISGAKSGPNDANVAFKIWIRPEGGPNVPKTFNHAYSGDLVDIDIPLDKWAGKKADFILEVDALNPSASRDWACWVRAQILR